MKIAVTSQGTGIDSKIDPRFGRAAYILIIDMSDEKVEVIDKCQCIQRRRHSGCGKGWRLRCRCSVDRILRTERIQDIGCGRCEGGQ